MILNEADTSNGDQVMCQSAWCTSRLARGNAQGQTHSETSSNYRCTNGGQESGGMTPSRARGRPRSEERRDAVLTAAMELMQEDDLRRASVDRIAERSGVSKATIYKWWPNRTAVAIDAFLHQFHRGCQDGVAALFAARSTARSIWGHCSSFLPAVGTKVITRRLAVSSPF